MHFTIQELAELLNGDLNVATNSDHEIKNFEFTPNELQKNNQGRLCFIAISNERWNDVHNKQTQWKDGNHVVLQNHKNCDLVITEKLIPELKDSLNQIIVDNSYASLRMIAEASREKMTNTVIGITGSVGKSSTRLLLEHLLAGTSTVVATRGNHNTQTGVPLYVSKLCTNPDVGILEISLNALNNRGNLSLLAKPQVAIVTSIGEAHVTTLHSTKNIAKFKARIFEGLEKEGLAILNANINEDERNILYEQAKKRTNRIKTYSVNRTDADIYVTRIIHEKYKSTVQFMHQNKEYTFDMKLPSLGAIENALCAILCLVEIGYSIESFLPKLSDFESLDRIMQLKKFTTKDGRKIEVIDDSHNAAIPSMLNAIRTFQEKAPFYIGRKILVLGQVADLGEQSEALHETLLPHILKANPDFVFGHGTYMRKIIQRLPSHMIGGWFSNANHLARLISIYCTDDSLVLLKGSVTGSDFRVTSYILPGLLTRSNRFLADDEINIENMTELLQPVAGLVSYHLAKEEVVLSIGNPSVKAVEGLSPIILLCLILQKGIQHNRVLPLQEWPTNQGESIHHIPFETGTLISDQVLLNEVMITQHPSAVFELAYRYFGSRDNGLYKIHKITNKYDISPESVHNLTGRFRPKEQQTYELNDLVKVGKLLKPYQQQLPVVFEENHRQFRGLYFGNLRLSYIIFYAGHLLCGSGFKSHEQFVQMIQEKVRKR